MISIIAACTALAAVIVGPIVRYTPMRNTILTFVLTIIGGVLIFVIGQLLLKVFIDPIQKLRAIKGSIIDSLSYYAKFYSNPGMITQDNAKKTSHALRKLGSELMAITTVLPWYRFWSLLRVVPKLGDISKAHCNLIGLSNGLSTGDAHDNRECVQKIKEALHLPKELLR